MDAKSYHLPNEVANISRCSMCEEYLSCGPIMGYNGNFICGRCGKDDQNGVVQVALEKIMTFFVFPCRYDRFGCKEQFLFNTSMQHERICQYRTVPCPALLNNPCNFAIPVLHLYTHCVKFHNNLITNDGDFQINVDQDVCCNLVMVKDNITVIIKYVYNSKSKHLQLDVASASVLEELISFKIRILSKLLEGMNINLPEKQCTVYESYTVSKDSIIIEIDKYLWLFSNTSSLIFKIFLITAATIPERSKNECQPLSSIALVHNLCVNDSHEEEEEEEGDQLKDIRDMFCYSCNCLSYPLYYDPTLSQIKCCLKCRGDHHTTEYLGSCDDLSDKRYPCDYKGCSFYGGITDLILHVKGCEYRTFLCTVDGCKSKDVFSLNETYIRINHLRTHAKYCPNPNKITISLYNIQLGLSVEKYFTHIRNVFILFTAEMRNCTFWDFNCHLPSGIEMEITFYHLSTQGCKGSYFAKFVGYCDVHFDHHMLAVKAGCNTRCLTTAVMKFNKI
ncbi:hypothetical protein RI129_010012 [Pyrocoelia pectoralis]|uniref:SIAH-type domain-containing protein n=1 Tax=Pyrocoelia pectoralis TaxID=417401 RepID=A0AAN7ZCT8_9COLE